MRPLTISSMASATPSTQFSGRPAAAASCWNASRISGGTSNAGGAGIAWALGRLGRGLGGQAVQEAGHLIDRVGLVGGGHAGDRHEGGGQTGGDEDAVSTSRGRGAAQRQG
jgi:hypothetical protein